jgi:hypothetical protein
MDRDDMAIDLDKALHHLLSRQNFRGPGHIRVSVSRDTESLPSALNLQVEPNPVMWAFDPENAAAIIAAAMR